MLHKMSPVGNLNQINILPIRSHLELYVTKESSFFLCKPNTEEGFFRLLEDQELKEKTPTPLEIKKVVHELSKDYLD